MDETKGGSLHLSAERLAAHLERRLQGEERRTVVTHLVECAECRREYAEADRLRPRSRRAWRGFATGIMLAAAAGLAFVMIPPRRTTELDAVRDVVTERVAQPDVTPTIQVASPGNGESLTSTRVLTWHAASQNTLYRVTVQTAEGTVVWRMTSNDTSVAIPGAVDLAAAETFYWFVEALHADGRSARSRASAFRP